MRILGLFFRLTGGFVLAAAVILVIVSAIAFVILKTAYKKEMQTDMDRYAISVFNQIEEEIIKTPKDGVMDVLVHFKKQIGLELGLYQGSEGKFFRTDEKIVGSMTEYLDYNKEEVYLSLRNEKFRRIIEDDALTYLFLIKEPVESKSIILLRKDYRDLVNRTKTTALLFISVILILIATLWGAAYWTYYKLVESFRSIEKDVGRIAGGDIDFKLAAEYQSELGNLSAPIYKAVNQLRDKYSDLLGEKEILETIVSTLQGGVLVLDESRKIISANLPMLKILGSDQLIGRLYWEVIRDLSLLEQIERLERDKTHLIEEIQIQDRHYLSTMNSIHNGRQMVLIFYDITALKNLEKVKKDFVTNVSHELKTPLTAIKGFVETLIETDKSAEHKKFLEIIQRNTDRLIRIVHDLLTLSELEQKDQKTMLESVDLLTLIHKVLPVFDKGALLKDIKIEVDARQDHYRILGDEFKLEQLFLNLIDNSLKYTEKGTVTINLYSGNHEIIAEITDTGIGIPDKHIDRLFERFYTVDKSRSRSLGGTGLGLSIVKHIVQIHSGKIDVKSRIGHGTTFTIRFPSLDA